MLVAILYILVSCSLINDVTSFAIPKSKLITRCDHFIATSTSLSQTSSLDNGASLPFFAAPAFTTSSPQSPPTSPQSTTTQQTATQTTVTTRLPLGTLFDGRDYIFITESNVRGYEWTNKETDVLLDDLMDAALGNLGGLSDDYDDTNGDADNSVDKSDKREETSNNSNNLLTITTDYELSQITLVPTSDWDSQRLGLGNRYDVYDGQQRLVTLNLLLAGLRNSFQSEANELLKVEERNKVNGYGFSVGGGKRAVALDATANEISNMLMPTKVRKEDVMRITLRKRDNVLLNQILIGDTSTTSGENEDEEEISTQSYTSLSNKQKTQLLQPLSIANTRILNNFIHISNRLTTLTTRERLRLLDYIVERVYLLVCIPESSRIARNIVMSQGRKGMDNEPVDDFKGLVCFRYTLEESDMYDTFDSWDGLAVEPTSSKEEGGIKSVGRDIIASACLLRASAALRTKIRSRGGDEVYEWERWLRQELWLQNKRLAQQQPPQQEGDQVQPWQGKDFFIEEIEPSSIALYKFRTGQWDEFAFLSSDKKSMTKKQRDLVISRLTFLREITMGVTSTKEAEIAILELLLSLEYAAGSSSASSNSIISRYLDEILPLIEKWTLWMALTKPSPMQRHSRVFALLDAMAMGSPKGSDDDDEDMVTSMKEGMDTYEFGAAAGGKRLAAAILKRMSTHVMLQERKTIPVDHDDATVDMIQQQNWSSEEEREEWSTRIGNLALISQPSRRRTARGKKSDVSLWESKTKMYKKEPWILTKQLAECDEWDVSDVKDQQKEMLSLMNEVWSLV